MTFWEKASALPPVLCRLLAHEAGRVLSEQVIYERAAEPDILSQWDVMVISKLTDWERVNLEQMRTFLNGCDMDFDDAKTFRRLSDYLSRTPNFAYLRRDPRYKTLYLPLLLIWLRSAVNNPPQWRPLRELVDRLRPLLKGNHAPRS